MDVQSPNNMKVKSLTTVNAIPIFGTSVGGDTTFNPVKQRGIVFQMENSGVIMRFQGKTTLVPYANIKSIELEDNA